jgi:hypothetical protein
MNLFYVDVNKKVQTILDFFILFSRIDLVFDFLIMKDPKFPPKFKPLQTYSLKFDC